MTAGAGIPIAKRAVILLDTARRAAVIWWNMKSLLRLAFLSFTLAAAPAGAAVKQYWVYKATNLLVDPNVADVVALLQRGRACGVTHLLLTDSKFSRLAEMDPRYFKNEAAVRAAGGGK